MGLSFGCGRLTDLETVELFDCYGISVVEFREVRGAEEAVAAAQELGYPVVAKAIGGGYGTWGRRDAQNFIARRGDQRADARQARGSAAVRRAIALVVQAEHVLVTA
ncbi:acetate--CoA ligase family protein [Nocardia brasiliensis]